MSSPSPEGCSRQRGTSDFASIDTVRRERGTWVATKVPAFLCRTHRNPGRTRASQCTLLIRVQFRADERDEHDYERSTEAESQRRRHLASQGRRKRLGQTWLPVHTADARNDLLRLQGVNN